MTGQQTPRIRALAVTFALLMVVSVIAPAGLAGSAAAQADFTEIDSTTVAADGTFTEPLAVDGENRTDQNNDATFINQDNTPELTVNGAEPGTELDIAVEGNGDRARFVVNGEVATIERVNGEDDVFYLVEDSTQLDLTAVALDLSNTIQLDVSDAVLPPADFDVSINDTASTTNVTAGENATVNATVENTGGREATQTLRFSVNDSEEATQDVTLASGATQAVEFTYPTEAADDDATATVASENDSDSRTLSVTEPANTTVTINDDASTIDVTAGEDAIINATVTNAGEEPATQTINFTVNGTDVDSSEVTDLASGASETVEFNFTTTAADDDATVEVSSDDDADNRTLTVAEQANFTVSINDEASTTNVTATEDAVLNATIENTGDETATQTINFTVNGTDEGNRSVELAGDDTETVEFTYTTELADDNATAAIASENDTETRTLNIAEPTPANFNVAIDDEASTTNVTATEDAVLNATIENTGDETATQTIEFSVNGTDEGNRSVELDGGATETVEFTYTTELADDNATAAIASENDTETRTLNIAEPTPANFTVSELDPQNATVNVSETFTISATITNTGDQTGEQDIRLLTEPTNDEALATEPNVSLDAGANQTVSFENVSIDQVGEFNHTVASENDSATGNLTVTEQPDPADPANFTVSDLDPQDATVNVSETFTVSATIENTGDQTGTQDIELLTEPTADTSLDTETVTLDAGNSTTVSFENVSIDQVGEFNHTVASENDSATGTLTVEAQDDGDDPAEPDPQASVTFDNQTVPNGTETVTVASANYTLGDGTPGDYVVVAHVVNDDGSISDPVGYSSNLTGEATNITVDLNASEAQGDELDTLTETTTLRAMLHETSSDSAFGQSLELATDDATITVEADDGGDAPDETPATANLSELDIAGQGDTARITPGDAEDVAATIENTGDREGSFETTLTITDDNGTAVVSNSTTVTVNGSATETVTFENETGNLTADEYSVTVTADGSQLTGSLTVKEAPAAIGGDGNATAQDVDGDGTFEDVNGDGELSVEDVFELFNNQDAVPDDDITAFDFNNDGEFNVLDVQRLLNEDQEGN